MEFKDVSDTALKLIDKIDKLWSLFFISNLGVAVWIFADENTMNKYLSSLATLSYIAYSMVNFLALIRAYKFLELIMVELKLSLDNNGIISEKLRKALQNTKYKNRIPIVIISYVVAVLFILFLLWTDTPIKNS